MAVPLLLYGSETWTVKKEDKMRIQAEKMKFSWSVKGFTVMDKIRNEEIRKELEVFSIEEKR
jgi:hypothetical protein